MPKVRLTEDGTLMLSPERLAVFRLMTGHRQCFVLLHQRRVLIRVRDRSILELKGLLDIDQADFRHLLSIEALGFD